MADEEKPDYSDVQLGSSSTLPTPEPAEQTYTIVSGDSLSKIAKHFYGDGRLVIVKRLEENRLWPLPSRLNMA